MYSQKQQAINHYIELIGDESMRSYNTLEPEPLKMPPMVEVNWDTNDTKEFDRLLHKILFEEKNMIQ